MRHEFSLNGRPKLKLIPDNAAEKLLLEMMAEESEKGATTVLAMPPANGTEFVLSVGDK